MLIQRFVLKVINNEGKFLTLHAIIDRIAEQIVFVITQVCIIKIKIMNSSEHTAAKFLTSFFIFIYSLPLC